MTRIAKYLLLTLFLSGLYSAAARAQTINAASCSSSDVQTAFNSVTAATTTVNIPSCPSGTAWTTPVTLNIPAGNTSLTVQGQTTVAGTCAPGGACTPSDSTVIVDNVSGTGLTVNTVTGGSFRLTGITFNPSSGTPAYGAIDVSGGSTSVRFDHNHFNDTVNGDHTIQPDAVNGVFDHNFFDSTNQANLFFIQPTINGPDGESNATWTVPDNFGTSQFLFVENNFFQNGAFIFDCDFGGRIVFRYNTGGTNSRIQTHGVGSGAQRRGCRAMEVYQNTFTFSSNPNTNSFAFLVDYESGTAMWWGNTITGFSTFLREDEVRSNTDTYTQTATPNGWGYCGNGASNWDQNSNSSGYACLDQIGRGAGNLLTGSFPNLVNQLTGTISWPNQAVVPVYAWDNTLNTNSYAPNHYWVNYESPATATENKDYYLQLPNVDENVTFNGTKGVGQGLASAKPSTCTPAVGWWGTDTQTLYVCQTTNTWVSYYTPYTYPHPLVSGLNSGGPAAPTNLAVAVQ